MVALDNRNCLESSPLKFLISMVAYSKNFLHTFERRMTPFAVYLSVMAIDKNLIFRKE
jgi:hypothetical protein